MSKSKRPPVKTRMMRQTPAMRRLKEFRKKLPFKMKKVNYRSSS